MNSMDAVTAVLGLVTIACTVWAVSAVTPRRRVNRRRHRLASLLSISPTLWRGPQRYGAQQTGGFAATGCGFGD